METEFISISISKTLKEHLERSAEKTGFSTIQEYIVFVLTEVHAEDEGEQDFPLSKEQEDKIEQRLRELGYI